MTRSRDRRMTDKDVMTVMMLRACGYGQEEISELLGFSQSSIAYRLRQIKEKAAEEGVEQVFVRYMYPLIVTRVRIER